MATNAKILIAGALTSTGSGPASANLGPSAAKTWLINSLILTNRESTTIPVKVEASAPGGSAYPVVPNGLMVPAGGSVVIDYDLMLMKPASGPGDQITVSATFAGAASSGVSYVAMGVERDVSN